MKRLAAAALAPFALAGIVAGCAGMGAGAPPRYHVLEAAASGAPAAPALRGSVTLLVAPTTAFGIYEMPQIVYSRSAGTRSLYQLNEWAQPPARGIGALLVERLAASGAFATVAAATDGVTGALLLSTQLDEIYHDAATRPGTAVITLSAVLSDPALRTVVARHRFSVSAPAASYDAAGAVGAFDRALATLLGEVVEWARQAAQEGGATQVTRASPPADQARGAVGEAPSR